MKIQVKATHIRRGGKGELTSCPIALAIAESLSARNVIVRNSTVQIGKKHFILPLEAQTFISCFDRRKNSVSPFEFEL